MRRTCQRTRICGLAVNARVQPRCADRRALQEREFNTALRRVSSAVGAPSIAFAMFSAAPGRWWRPNVKVNFGSIPGPWPCGDKRRAVGRTTGTQRAKEAEFYQEPAQKQRAKFLAKSIPVRIYPDTQILRPADLP